MAERKGTRCAVCVGCGKCFEESPAAGQAGGQRWSGKRCEVCVACGECAKAWGLVPDDAPDAVSGATNWADAFKAMDPGTSGEAPVVIAPPGTGKDGAEGSSPAEGPVDDVDATTGATPGVATACKELGLDDMASLGEALGIKPPGVA